VIVKKVDSMDFPKEAKKDKVVREAKGRSRYKKYETTSCGRNGKKKTDLGTLECAILLTIRRVGRSSK